MKMIIKLIFVCNCLQSNASHTVTLFIFLLPTISDVNVRGMGSYNPHTNNFVLLQFKELDEGTLLENCFE